MGEWTRRLTAVENEFELNEFHVNQIRCDCFMSHTHAEVLQLHNISLQRVIKTILEGNEIWYLANDD